MTSPLLKIWALVAAFIAAFALLRGAWPVALAVFVLSPAPVWLFSGGAPRDRLSFAWLGGLAALIAIALALVLAAAYTGGIPEVHEWRSALRGAG